MTDPKVATYAARHAKARLAIADTVAAAAALARRDLRDFDLIGLAEELLHADVRAAVRAVMDRPARSSIVPWWDA